MADIKKVAWNASEGLIMEISNKRRTANDFFIQDKIKKAINTLISIKQSVVQSFSKEEREELKKIEEDFYKISPALNSSMGVSFNLAQKQIFFSAQLIAKKIYSTYNDELMDLLEKYGYLIGEQTDSSRMRF